MRKEICLLLGLLVCIGCAAGDDGLPPTVNASGTVTLDGSPVEGASVVFVDVAGVNSANASTDASGRFSLNAFETKSGAIPGSYKVMVSKTIEVSADDTTSASAPAEEAEHAADSPDAGASWENALPKRYASIGSSGLEVEIPQAGVSDIQLELTSN